MPGKLTGPITGFTDRAKGKGVVSSSWLAQMGKGAAQMAGGGCLAANLSVAGFGNTADTGPDTLTSLILPPNTFDLVGRNLEIQAWGTTLGTVATRSVGVTWGMSPGSASIVAGPMTLTTSVVNNWLIVLTVFKQASNVQIGFATYELSAAGAAVSRIMNNYTAGSEVDTAAIIIGVTASVSTSTANSVLCNGLAVYGFN